MTVHLTPPADLDPLAEADRAQEQVNDNRAAAAEVAGLTDEMPPGLAFEYLWEAADAARSLSMWLRRAAALSQRSIEAAMRASGCEYCLVCRTWQKQERMTQDATGPDPNRANHWWRCSTCSVSTIPAETPQSPKEAPLAFSGPGDIPNGIKPVEEAQK